jgi:hypothetical protein
MEMGERGERAGCADAGAGADEGEVGRLDKRRRSLPLGMRDERERRGLGLVACGCGLTRRP